MVHGLIKISDQEEGNDKNGERNSLVLKNKKPNRFISKANRKTPALININFRVGPA